MSLKRNERYPGRFNNPTTDHPQGAFKNRTAPSAQDGSYLEQDWANDWDGFFGRLLTLAAITPSGNVDTAQSSQYFDALRKLTLQRSDPFGDIATDGTVSTALTNLGLANFADALLKTNNLSDLVNKATSRTNLSVPKGVDKQMCNEWAVFNGVTTVTIGDSIGISSITRTGAGQYTVNLSTPYATINYAVAGRWTSSSAQIDRDHELSIIQATKTVNSFQLYCASDSSSSYPSTDAVELSLAVWGAK